MAVLECKDLSKQYGGAPALTHVNLTIEPGRIVGLLGPNGSGKTTLIKLANGLLSPSHGEVLICGEEPGPESKALVSYLPDKTCMPMWMNVEQLMDFFQDFYADFDRQRAETMLDRLGLDRKKKLRQMSKGTKEKVQLVLVMARKAQLYLLDDPLLQPGDVGLADSDHIGHLLLGALLSVEESETQLHDEAFPFPELGDGFRKHPPLGVQLQRAVDQIRFGAENIRKEKLVPIPVNIERFVDRHLVFQRLAFAQVHQNFIFDAARSVGGKFDSPARAEGVDRLDQADGADGDQVLLIAGLGIILFDDVRHQAEIVLHQAVAGGQIALGPLLQALPLLLPGQGTGKGAGITGQMQGQKQAVGQQQQCRR